MNIINRYNTLNSYFKNKYGEKILKVSLDGGFSCPNRENGLKGCLFCSEKGAGEFAGSRNLSITEQITEQIEFLKNKSKSNKYIAYFQNFTNTYDTVENLEKVYFEALNNENIIGIAIATRADCLNDKIIDLLDLINKKFELWIELGFQTSNEKTANLIRRGYDNSVFSKAVDKLKKKNIKIVTHLIFGLPYEIEEDWINSIKYISDLNIWGIKFHSLYIQNDSDIYNYYIENKFTLISKKEYVSIVCKAISLIPKDYIVHRITGDGDKSKLYLPKWSADKLSVIGAINKELKLKDIYQGNSY